MYLIKMMKDRTDYVTYRIAKRTTWRTNLNFVLPKKKIFPEVCFRLLSKARQLALLIRLDANQMHVDKLQDDIRTFRFEKVYWLMCQMRTEAPKKLPEASPHWQRTLWNY